MYVLRVIYYIKLQAHLGQVSSVTKSALSILCEQQNAKLGTVFKQLLDNFDSER